MVLRDHCLLHVGFRYVIEVRKGVASEFKVFITRYFADRCFERLRKKYGNGA